MPTDEPVAANRTLDQRERVGKRYVALGAERRSAPRISQWLANTRRQMVACREADTAPAQTLDNRSPIRDEADGTVERCSSSDIVVLMMQYILWSHQCVNLPVARHNNNP